MGKVVKKKKPLVPLKKPRMSDDPEEILQILKERLKRIRLKIPPRPLAPDGSLLDPALPRDITLLTDVDVGQLHGDFAAMVSYTYGQTAIQSVKHSIAKRVDRMVRARARLHKTGTVDDKAAKVEIDPLVKRETVNLLVAESMEELTRSIHDSYLIGKDLCSREITRRMGLNVRT